MKFAKLCGNHNLRVGWKGDYDINMDEMLNRLNSEKSISAGANTNVRCDYTLDDITDVELSSHMSPTKGRLKVEMSDGTMHKISVEVDATYITETWVDPNVGCDPRSCWHCSDQKNDETENNGEKQ